MRFVLRCIFWLSIVYASILWPHHASVLREEVASAGALTGAADLCRSRAAECVDDAVRLTSLLVRMTGDSDQAYVTGSANGSGPVGSRHRHEGLARAP